MDDYNVMTQTNRLTSLSNARRTEDSKADFYRFDGDSSGKSSGYSMEKYTLRE